MMAFFAENFITGEPISDPRFVTWVVLYVEHNDEEAIEKSTFYPMHPCTNEEFLRFKPPSTDMIRAKVK